MRDATLQILFGLGLSAVGAGIVVAMLLVFRLSKEPNSTAIPVNPMSISAAKCLKITILIFGLACNPSIAKEVVSFDRDFRVTRDFNPIILSKSDREVARVYFDGFKRAPSKDIDILNQIATNTLASKVVLVPAKDHANYIVQMIMSEIPNYAIKNTEGKVAHGFILIAICRLPLSSSPKDCENLTYHYFRDYESAALLRIILSRWMGSVFP